MSIQNLETLYLSDLVQAREDARMLVGAFAELASAANDPELADALKAHVSELSLQFDRMGRMDGLDRRRQPEGDDAMAALVAKAMRTIAAHERGAMRDAAMIAALQHIQHHLIATYGTLAAYAKLLGRHEEKRVLGALLEEERALDEDLTIVATGLLEPEAPAAYALTGNRGATLHQRP